MGRGVEGGESGLHLVAISLGHLPSVDEYFCDECLLVITAKLCFSLRSSIFDNGNIAPSPSPSLHFPTGSTQSASSILPIKDPHFRLSAQRKAWVYPRAWRLRMR
jgi:hypothetical protein